MTPDTEQPSDPRPPAASGADIDELRERLSAIVDSSDDAIVSWTLDGRIDSWNRAAEKIYGYPAAEVLGQPARQVLTADGETREVAITEGAARGERVSHVNAVRVRKDGTPVDVVVSVFPVKDRAGRITGACEIARDVTASRRAEQHLLATVNELKNIKAAIDQHSIVAITDAAGRITYVNDQFCAISKYSREELIGRDHRIINSRFHPKEFFKNIWQTISRGEVWRGEIKNRAKDGSFYWVDTTIYPFLNFAGRPTQYVAIRTDITQLKANEAKLQRFASDLAEQNKELETIVYTVSHDLRSPLVNVQGFSRQLGRVCETIRTTAATNDGVIPYATVKKPLEESIPQALRFISAGVAKMDMLLGGLLRYSRLGRVELIIKPLDMDALLAAAVAAAKFQFNEAGAEIDLAPLPVCLGDHAQTSQVFANLLDNALKYRAPGRPLRVVVRGRVEHGRAIYSVADNGIGIPTEHQPRVFEIFHRLNPDATVGEGLGLTIAQRVLERQQGRIWVESQAGEGATFFVALPVAPAGD